MKKAILGLLVGTILGGTVTFGLLKDIKGIEFKTEPKREQVSIASYENSEYGDIGNLSDGSWYLINKSENKFIFQPISMGDYEYQAKDLDQLNKMVQTYIEIQNNGSY